MIVRDEAANLARALDSLRGCVDEVVVVDTGSKDNTVAIARSFGARTFEIDWANDFSAARNASLQQAKGSWILYVDADEELRETQPGALRRLCRSLPKSAAGAFVTVHCPVDSQGMAEEVAAQCRLFRNSLGLHFEGRIHEQLRLPSGRTPSNIAAPSADVSLYHWGYIPDGDLMQRKGDRNRQLLELTIAEDPLQPAHHFNLGRQLVWEGRFDQAIAPLEQAMALWREQGQRMEGYAAAMFSTAALAISKVSPPAAVLDLLARTPADAVSSELLYVAGVACLKAGELSRAVDLLNRAWQDPTLAKSTGTDPSTSGWRPLAALAEAYDGLGQRGRAKEALDRALALAPGHPEVTRLAGSLSGAGARCTVSACMIVRDEERHLRESLQRVRPAVDDLVIVDTGSTDATVTIAQEFGARVFHFPWCDDFSAARNESLRHALGEWIIWVDADDELVEQESGALRRLCSEAPDGVSAYWVPCHSVNNAEGEVGVIVRQCRLFRNHHGIEFRGLVHEQPLLATAPLDQDRVFVRHWGYVADPQVLAAKCERNRKLLERSIAEAPSDAFLYYSLGKQYVWQHAYEQALDVLNRGLRRWEQLGSPEAPYVGPMFAVAACCALNLSRNPEALVLEDRCPPAAVSSDLLYYAAIACQRLERPAEAISRLERAIDDPTVRQSTETDPTTATWRPLLLLSQIKLALGNQTEAYEAARRAIELVPDRADVLMSWATQAWRSGHPADAERTARRILERVADEAYRQRAAQLLHEIQAAAVPT